MKTLRLYIAIATVGLLFFVGAGACKKIISNIFQGVDSDIPEFTVTLPAIPFVATTETSLGSYNQSFNLDSTMKATTAGVYGANDVKSIKVKQIELKVVGADATNNIANFESARFTFFSNSDPDVVQIASTVFPDSYSDSTVVPANGAELKPYLKGSVLTYNVYGKLRRVTTKNIDITLNVTLRIQ